MFLDTILAQLIKAQLLGRRMKVREDEKDDNKNGINKVPAMHVKVECARKVE